MEHNFDTPFDTLPSIELDHRPFFSIVIACYNSTVYLERLLNSIKEQHMNDDIEVILADDCSTEDYQFIVDRFNRQLCIRQIKTDYNFAPGNTREKGCSIATGEWLCFADHDDRFIPDALPKIKAEIEQFGEKYHVIANFREVSDMTFQPIQEMIHTRNWCHGKFYNLDNLWKAYDIHFKKDLKTHEDIYISTNVMCILTALNGDRPLYSDEFVYEWIANPLSISRTKYNDTNFVENFFKDYLTSTGEVAIDTYLKGSISATYTINKVFDVLLYCFFYINRFRFARPNDWVKENMVILGKFYRKAKEILMFSNRDMYDTIALHDAKWYADVRKDAAIGVGPCIEQQTLWDFLQELAPDRDPNMRLLNW